MPFGTVGDVSGSTTLTDDDHLYPAHINELRHNRVPFVVVAAAGYGDYNCDGVDDDIQLQAALDALETAGGGLLFIRAGNYSLNNYLRVTSNITVEGEGFATVLKLKDNATGPWRDTRVGNEKAIGVISIMDDTFTAASATFENIIIRDLLIDVNGANQDVDGNYQFSGIMTELVKNCRIENVRVNNAKWAGICSYTYAKPDFPYSSLTITGCNFHNCGISVNGYLDEYNSGGVFFSHGLTGAVIDKCFANSCQQGFVMEDAAEDCVISNNTAYDCTKSGINFRNARHTKVHHNTCYNNGLDGISSHNDCRGTTIDNNSCHENTRYGINAGTFGVSIHGNKCYQNGDAGIYMVAYRSSVLGNHCINNGTADSPTYAAGIVLNGVIHTIVGNHLIVSAAEASPAAQLYGLYIVSTGKNMISNNEISGVTAAVYGNFAATDKVRDNDGFVTENKGTGSITAAVTSDIITHGLGYTPVLADISITLGENPTNTPGAIWVDTITDTYFTVNCENVPGASNLDFSWKAKVL